MGKFFEAHKRDLVIALSGAILLGSGVSLGVGLTELGKSAPSIQTAGFSTGGSNELINRLADEPIAGPININTASAMELESLPRIGSVIAQRIIDYRKKNGPFKTTAEIQNVSGIGPTTYAQIKDRITVK